MATILGARSFDCGNSMLNTVDASDLANVVASDTTAKTGSYSLRIRTTAATTSWGRWAITGTPANPSVSLWIYLNDHYDNDGWSRLRFHLDSGLYIDLRWDATAHTYDAYVNDVKVADGTVEVSVNSWFHVQFYVVVADAGSIGVKIDGVQSIDDSGDTKPGCETGADYFYIYVANPSAGSTEYSYYDDLVWGSGGYLSDLRCVDIRPSADTAQDDWTPSTGSDNYAMVDETPESDADYNETNTNAHADELALEDFDGATYTPAAVVACARAKMLAATGDSIKVGIDSAGTDDVTEHSLSTEWEYYFHTADDNPADSAEWEDADIDALKLRYEAVIA